MADASLVFDIIGRDRASAAFNKVGGASDNAQSRLSKMGDSLKTVGKMAGVAALAAGAVAIKLGVDGVKGAMEDQAAQVKLATQLRNTAKANSDQIAGVEKWIDATQRATGVADDQLRPALSRLVTATGDVGKGQKMLSLAMDVSAGTGKSLDTVTTALAKAQNGSVAGLARLGIATKDAEGNTKSFADIQDELAKKFKGQSANAAGTAEGAMKRLKVAYDETLETVGAKLLPVLANLGDWFLNKGMPAMSRMWDVVKAKLLPVFQDLWGWVQDKLLPVLGKIADFVMQKVIPAVSDFYSWIAEKLLPPLKEFAGAVLEGVKGALEKVGDAIERNRPFLETMFGVIKDIAGWLASNLLPVLGTLYKVALPLLGTAIGLAIDVVKTLTNGFLLMSEWGVRGFKFLLDAAMTTFQGILNAAAIGLGWIPGLGDKIKGARDAFTDFHDKTVGKLDAVADKLRGVRDAINEIPNSKTVDIDVHVATTQTKSVQSKQTYATGTTYATGGVALVGERGPELVRLNRGAQVVPNDKLMGMGGGSVTINFNGLVTDPKATAREIQRILLQQKRTTGTELGLA